ncbi:TonB-dependent receptor, partial [Desulfosarcina sp.]|nr:TonB-dependent receptor [Desulfosarcina sp.]
EIEKNFFSLLNFSAGIRLEHFAVNGGRKETKPILRGGLSLKLLQETYVRFSIGQGFRYPTIAERFITTEMGSFAVFANPDLMSETSVNSEIGIKQGFKFSNYFGYIDAAVFQQDYTNTIEYLFGKWTPDYDWPFFGFKFINTGKSRITGIDISITGIGKIQEELKIKTMLGYNYIMPKTRDPDYVYAQDYTGSGNEFSYNTTSVDPSKGYLKYRFLHTIKGDIEFNFYNTSVGASIKYFSRIENLDKAIEDLEDATSGTGGTLQPIEYMDYFYNHNNGQFVLDLRLAYTLKERHRFSIISDNILNRWYSLRPLMPEQMRKVVFQYSLSF